MEERYNEAIQAYEEKNFILALQLFSSIETKEAKEYENKCIDNLEDLIYYSKRKEALAYLEKLKFYKDFIYFEDTYKRKRTDFFCKIFMFSCAIIATLIMVILLIR